VTFSTTTPTPGWLSIAPGWVGHLIDQGGDDPHVGDQARERRIEQEIVVDAYDPHEQAMGWYHHLQDAIGFPFMALCSGVRAISPLQVGDEVEVVGMAPVEECGHEMFVLIRWEHGTLGIPLSQLDVTAGDARTREAVQDWRYWVGQGYQL
jgi:hypothetical protein